MRLVCLHALTRDRHDFDAFLPRVDDLDPLALDALGHGDAPRAERYRLVDYADYAQSLLPEGPLVLYGHSLGGQTAVCLAGREPGRFAGLVLEDPPLLSPLRLDEPSQFRRGFEGLRRIMTKRGKRYQEADWIAAVRSWPSGHGEATIEEAMGEAAAERRGRQIARLDVGVLTATLDGTYFLGFDPLAALAAAGCPVTIIVGEEQWGGAIGPSDLRVLAGEPGVSIVRAPEQGHYVREADPSLCETAVRDLVRSAR
ncbi:MAG: alpha/beta hydrolase [Pseudomonadota bacterium]